MRDNLSFWHASVYNSAWIAMIFLHIFTPIYGTFVGIAVVLLLSMIIEGVRKIVKIFFHFPASARTVNMTMSNSMLFVFKYIFYFLLNTLVFCLLILLLFYVEPMLLLAAGVEMLAMSTVICFTLTDFALFIVIGLRGEAPPHLAYADDNWVERVAPHFHEVEPPPSWVCPDNLEDFFEEVELDPEEEWPICPILLEPCPTPVRLYGCSHFIDRESLITWMRTTPPRPPTCPLCRAEIIRRERGGVEAG